MRLFVAVLPPPAVLAELEAAVAPLQALPGADGLRWTDRDGWHLTLAFLGEVPEERLPVLGEALARAALDHPVHRLRLAGGGHFGGRVLWVGMAGETWTLRALARSVAVAVGEVLDEGADAAEFHPHLTLARSGRHPAAGPLHAAAAELVPFHGAEFPVTAVHLVRSDLHAPRARYTSLRSWPLKPG
ncbi:RNA 2',3'-cyclic phosphodiesterase [Kitasatospora viridis]|uniref:RNA 2',3'-cyclic phosphodiesterase n=1 Tax=Kitasatospora viridis TaxID=281105 RepID=A0A561UGC0_9ACTN|nr:RNA 2',3'-cyclic phosphodiesterase [Kitasatospora viridis]TWF98409.1 2'-5' RNA ligase [Kitasatospora viridis]